MINVLLDLIIIVDGWYLHLLLDGIVFCFIYVLKFVLVDTEQLHWGEKCSLFCGLFALVSSAQVSFSAYLIICLTEMGNLKALAISHRFSMFTCLSFRAQIKKF